MYITILDVVGGCELWTQSCDRVTPTNRVQERQHPKLHCDWKNTTLPFWSNFSWWKSIFKILSASPFPGNSLRVGMIEISDLPQLRCYTTL